MTSASLGRVARGDLCAGCGACAAVAPGRVRMAVQAPGYLRPVQDGALTGAEEAQIAAICPGLGLVQEAAGRPDHAMWGPVLSTLTGWAGDPALRHQGSSGGALSAILTHLLATDVVDRVLQTTAALVPAYGNRSQTSTTAAEVFAAAGSRYAPSAPLADLAGELARPGRVAFVGKPCDVAALRALAARNAAVAAKFPVLISFFCAGVPSLAGARALVAALGVAEADLAAFRYRGQGWPGRAVATRRDGTSADMSYHDSWGGILSKHVQFRCKICPDGTGGFADIVCADAWATDARGYPLFEEQAGVSLILARTSLGEALVRAAMDRGDLVAAPHDLGTVAAMQPGQTRRKRVLLARLAALGVLGRPRPRYRGFHLATHLRGAGPKALLREFLGTCRRLIRRPARQPADGGDE